MTAVFNFCWDADEFGMENEWIYVDWGSPTHKSTSLMNIKQAKFIDQAPNSDEWEIYVGGDVCAARLGINISSGSCLRDILFEIRDMYRFDKFLFRNIKVVNCVEIGDRDVMDWLSEMAPPLRGDGKLISSTKRKRQYPKTQHFSNKMQNERGHVFTTNKKHTQTSNLPRKENSSGNNSPSKMTNQALCAWHTKAINGSTIIQGIPREEYVRQNGYVEVDPTEKRGSILYDGYFQGYSIHRARNRVCFEEDNVIREDKYRVCIEMAFFDDGRTFRKEKVTFVHPERHATSATQDNVSDSEDSTMMGYPNVT